MSTLYRSTVLAVAGFGPLRSLIETRGLRAGVGRFVAGETLDDALTNLERLEERGLCTILDLLGEFVDSEEGVAEMLEQVLATVQLLAGRPQGGQLSVKPSQLGLDVSYAVALAAFRRVAAAAQGNGVHLCLDMENHPYVDETLRLVETLQGEGYREVSTVLQSYLRRSPTDLARLLALPRPPAIRIVKGAYKEPARVAYPEKSVVDASYRELVYDALAGGAYVNIATHDESILSDVATHLRQHGIGTDRYEFQLLYGVKPAQQARLADAGHRVRIYLPFGRDWYGYFSRRLAERPANLAFVLRGLFG